MNLQVQSLSDVRERLNYAFGSIKNSTSMHASVLCRGKYGLHNFYSKFIEHILDWYDIGR